MKNKVHCICSPLDNIYPDFLKKQIENEEEIKKDIEKWNLRIDLEKKLKKNKTKTEKRIKI